MHEFVKNLDFMSVFSGMSLGVGIMLALKVFKDKLNEPPEDFIYEEIHDGNRLKY